MTRKAVTLADVANSLGVSKALVSLVVNNKADDHGISRETQEKVRKKIKELKYEPNAMARGFRIGKTNTIGLLVSDISNRFYARLARCVEDLASQNGYSVIICSTDEIIDKEIKQLRLLRDKKVDGMIISTSQTDASYFNAFIDEGFPHVLIDRTFNGLQSPFVSVDNYGGGRMAARHLLTQGIRKVAVIGISPDHISTINERIKGFLSAMDDAGYPCPSDRVIRAPFQEIERQIKEKLQQFYSEGDLPEAIFTLNNNLTLTCMSQLRKLSLKIPEDILLIGFDDDILFNMTHPAVTVIDQPLEQIAEKAFHLLISQMQKKNLPMHERKVFLPVDIVIRESSIKPFSV